VIDDFDEFIALSTASTVAISTAYTVAISTASTSCGAEEPRPVALVTPSPVKGKKTDPALCLENIEDMHRNWKSVEVKIKIIYL
jgi:hypothetical protein